jgi:hypothetical protein
MKNLTRINKIKVYREDDWVAFVEVLEDTSDKEWERYKLKVIKTIKETNIYKPILEGTEFCVEAKKGYFYGGMWTLRDD